MGTSGFSKTGFSVGQVTVRMHTKQVNRTPLLPCLNITSNTYAPFFFFFTNLNFRFQSMAVYDKKNRLVAGDPHKIQNVREYVVFQRALTDPEDVWKIYGKVAPTEQKF
jgi:Tim44-like domain